MSLQTACPVLHATVPRWHGFPGVHVAPAEQALQLPWKQYLPAPQPVPSVRLTPRSPQTAAPVEQPIAPAWHGFAGVHACPTPQAMQPPAPSQTWPEPQEAPGPRLTC